MKKICLTPVKNEEWILESFLMATSLWADIIIIADQNSTDKTAAIAKSFNKVHYIKNEANDYNEGYRQEILINEARRFGNDNFLLALDADEILSANFLESKEWDNFFFEKPGTLMALQWANIDPDFSHYWRGFAHFPLGFIDNGKSKTGNLIHSPRIPIDKDARVIRFNEVQLLHLQFTYWERMLAKQIWYQVYERYKNTSKSFVDIYEQYNHYRYVNKHKHLLPKHWLYSLEKHGFSTKISYSKETFFWFNDIQKMISEKSSLHYKKLHIWDTQLMKNNFVQPPFFYARILPYLLENYGNLNNRFYKRWFKKVLEILQ